MTSTLYPDLKEIITDILCENAKNTIENKVDLIMKEIRKYESNLSVKNTSLEEDIKELKEERKIIIDNNVEMQRKLECIKYIMEGNITNG